MGKVFETKGSMWIVAIVCVICIAMSTALCCPGFADASSTSGWKTTKVNGITYKYNSQVLNRSLPSGKPLRLRHF